MLSSLTDTFSILLILYHEKLLHKKDVNICDCCCKKKKIKKETGTRSHPNESHNKKVNEKQVHRRLSTLQVQSEFGISEESSSENYYIEQQAFTLKSNKYYVNNASNYMNFSKINHVMMDKSYTLMTGEYAVKSIVLKDRIFHAEKKPFNMLSIAEISNLLDDNNIAPGIRTSLNNKSIKKCLFGKKEKEVSNKGKGVNIELEGLVPDNQASKLCEGINNARSVKLVISGLGESNEEEEIELSDGMIMNIQRKVPEVSIDEINEEDEDEIDKEINEQLEANKNFFTIKELDDENIEDDEVSIEEVMIKKSFNFLQSTELANVQSDLCLE